MSARRRIRRRRNRQRRHRQRSEQNNTDNRTTHHSTNPGSERTHGQPTFSRGKWNEPSQYHPARRRRDVLRSTDDNRAKTVTQQRNSGQHLGSAAIPAADTVYAHLNNRTSRNIRATATPSVAGLRRSRTITLPISAGGRWPRRRRRPTVSHPACRRCRPPAVSTEPSSAALRTVKEQRRFFTAVLATGEHSSPVTSASTAGVRCAPGPRAPKTFQNASG
jgi:hypothetical protein